MMLFYSKEMCGCALMVFSQDTQNPVRVCEFNIILLFFVLRHSQVFWDEGHCVLYKVCYCSQVSIIWNCALERTKTPKLNCMRFCNQTKTDFRLNTITKSNAMHCTYKFRLKSQYALLNVLSIVIKDYLLNYLISSSIEIWLNVIAKSSHV